MIRRPPTRLELKLDDIQEYEQIKKEAEAAKKRAANAGAFGVAGGCSGSGGVLSPLDAKSRADAVRERIGYDPGNKKP